MQQSSECNLAALLPYLSVAASYFCLVGGSLFNAANLPACLLAHASLCAVDISKGLCVANTSGVAGSPLASGSDPVTQVRCGGKR